MDLTQIIYGLVVCSIALGLALYFGFDFLAYFLGGPFVPTPQKEIKQILNKANLKKSQTFYELGGGLGLVAIEASKKYGVKAIMVEINPLLILISRLFSLLKNTKVTYINKNLFNISLIRADVIYVYLLPGSVIKLADKLIAECKNNCLIISKRFQIKPLKKHLQKIDIVNNSEVYYYLLKKR